MSQGQKDGLYRVWWINEKLPHEPKGQGQPTTKAIAESKVDAMNRKYPDIKHEVVPVDEDESPTS